MLGEHTLLFFLWMVFYALHSILASSMVKAKLNWNQKRYRLFYSVISTISLAFVLLYNATIQSFLIFPPDPVSNYIGLMLSAVGIFILKRAFRSYSLSKFIGLKEESQKEVLQTNGIQSRIRHPLYTGTVLIFVGYLLFNPQFSNLIMLISLFIYLPFGIYFEEKKLIEQFGDDYRTYRKTTPALIPNFKRKTS